MKNKLILLIAFLCTCAFAACEGDGDADYGFGKVYMPQAVSTGGLNNSYAVPSGGGDYTYNFRVENGTVRIILGVIRSGKLSDKKGYTVDVYTSAEDTAAAVSAFGGEAMPRDFIRCLRRSWCQTGKPVGHSTSIFPCWRFRGANTPARNWCFPSESGIRRHTNFPMRRPKPPLS